VVRENFFGNPFSGNQFHHGRVYIHGTRNRKFLGRITGIRSNRVWKMICAPPIPRRPKEPVGAVRENTWGAANPFFRPPLRFRIRGDEINQRELRKQIGERLACKPKFEVRRIRKGAEPINNNGDSAAKPQPCGRISTLRARPTRAPSYCPPETALLDRKPSISGYTAGPPILTGLWFVRTGLGRNLPAPRGLSHSRPLPPRPNSERPPQRGPQMGGTRFQSHERPYRV